MIDTYSFERPSTGKLVVLDQGSFFLAALVGPLYVLLSGFILEALAMTVATAVIAAVALFALVATIGLSSSQLVSVGAMFAIPIAALFFQGRIAIRLMRYGYLRRGWTERY